MDTCLGYGRATYKIHINNITSVYYVDNIISYRYDHVIYVCNTDNMCVRVCMCMCIYDLCLQEQAKRLLFYSACKTEGISTNKMSLFITT